MIVLSDLLDGMCTIEERKKDTLEIINYVSNNNFQNLEEHRKSIAPPPARARPSLLPAPKNKTQEKIYKAVDNATAHLSSGVKKHTKWFLRSGLDGSLTILNIGSYLVDLWGDPVGCIRFWVYLLLSAGILILAGGSLIEMILKFFG